MKRKRVETATVTKGHPKERKRERLESYSAWLQRKVPIMPAKHTMGIVTTCLSSWLFIPENLSQCAIRWIVLPKTLRNIATRLITPNIEAYWMDLEMDHSSVDEYFPNSAMTTDVVVFEGPCRPPKANHPLWTCQAQIIISDRGIRGYTPKDWWSLSRGITHEETGGVTDWTGRCHWFARKSIYGEKPSNPDKVFTPEAIKGAPNRLINLIDRTESGRRVSDKTSASLDPADDLLPWDQAREFRRTFLILPTVYGQNVRVRRTMVGKEVAACLDLPVTIIRDWNDTMLAAAVAAVAKPVKIVAGLGMALQACLKQSQRIQQQELDVVCIKGDSLKRGFTDSHETVSKRSKSSIPFSEEETIDSEERMSGYVKLVSTTTASEKAVKHDKAAVPTELWDDRVRYLLDIVELTDRDRKAFNLLRMAMLRRWRRNVVRSWISWWNENHYQLKEDEPNWWRLIKDRGKEACRHACESSFWAWPSGSSVFFWRWPDEYARDVAIGVPPCWIGMPKQKIVPQKGLGDANMLTKIADKIEDVRAKRYVCEEGKWKATMNYFAVPKGDSDIRMVYDGTKSGLNDCLYAPWFPLPDAEVLVRTLDTDYWCVDNDYGEMFLNFWIHPELQEYSAMDFTPIYGRKENGELWIEGWTRCAMGQSPSPFTTVQQTRRLKRLMLGDRQKRANVFRWNRIVINLPGSVDYRPGEPWISKRRQNGALAADAHDYVDDLRGTGPSSNDAWNISSVIAKTASYFGVQDAARKRREQTQRPGAWAGVVCGTAPDRPYISVTQEKWNKTREEIGRLRAEIDGAAARADNSVKRKVLEEVAGFVNHVGRAYPTLLLYLNGVYATMNAWRPDRDEDGWKTVTNDQGLRHIGDYSAAPDRVRLVRRMIFDVEAMEELTKAEEPPERFLRPDKNKAKARYYFGDASGAGFGMSGWSPGDDEIEVDFGAWEASAMLGSSSNFRELANIVMKIEALDAQGRVNAETEFFIFTDNVHAETAFYRGSAKSPEVLHLMFRLHKILMRGEAFIHVVWVAGKRMIAQGSDGLSRSDLTSGVLRGIDMLSYVPLHLSAGERQPQGTNNLLQRILGKHYAEALRMEPSQWFTAPQDSNGIFIWEPPPCLADVAIYMLSEAWHIRPWNVHVMLVPSLMSGKWRRMLYKIADIICVLPFGEEWWPRDSEYEPLTLAFIFPLLNRTPWRAKFEPLFRQQTHHLRTLHRQSVSFSGHYLCELWTRAWTLEGMPGGIPPTLLQRGSRP